MSKQVTMPMEEYIELKSIKAANEVRCKEWIEQESKEVDELISKLELASRDRVVRVYHFNTGLDAFINPRVAKLNLLKIDASKILNDDVKSIHDGLIELCEEYRKELSDIKEMTFWQRVFKWGK